MALHINTATGLDLCAARHVQKHLGTRHTSEHLIQHIFDEILANTCKTKLNMLIGHMSKAIDTNAWAKPGRNRADNNSCKHTSAHTLPQTSKANIKHMV